LWGKKKEKKKERTVSFYIPAFFLGTINWHVATVKLQRAGINNE